MQISNLSDSKDLSSIVKQQLCKKSNIIKIPQQAENLIEFFPHKVQKVQLLFKASENNFSMSKFMQICGNQHSTLILCQTLYGKIIGGYSPLLHIWNQQEQRGYFDPFISDETKSSFLFSLSNNCKFELQMKEEAIKRSEKNEAICFGDEQLWICDKADKTRACSFGFNRSYLSQNYQILNIEDLQKANIQVLGTESASFCLKQWEVWKVQIDE